MTYEIPQKLEYQEKILFGLTFKQSMYAVIFGLIDFVIFFKTNLAITTKTILIIFPTLLALGFMFLNLDQQIINFYHWFQFRKAEGKKVQDFFKTKRLAVFKITPNNFAIKTEDEQNSMILTFSRFLNSIEFPVQILMKTTPLNIEDYLNKLNVDKQYQGLFENNKKHLLELTKNTKNREFYLIIPEVDNLNIQSAICEEWLKSLNLKYEKVTNTINFPNKIENTPYHIKTDDTFNKVIYAHGYPRLVEPAFLDKIISTLGDFDLSLHINPYPIETMMVTLNKQLQKQKADLYTMNLKGTINPSLEIKYNDTKKVLEELQKGNDKLFNISLYINCRADSEEELNLVTRKVQATLNSLMIIPKLASFRMAKGLKSTLPLGVDELKSSRNITSKALATFYPFTSPFLEIDETGIWLGNNKNGIPVIKDIFKLSNPNGVILAQSGGGKSFFAKLLISRYLLNKTKVMVIDPQGEYRNLIKQFKGQRINLARTSKTIINPLDLMGHDYIEKRLALMDLMQVMLGGISEPQKALIDRALTKTYQKKGIDDNPKTWHKTPPILGDLLKTLKQMERRTTSLEKSSIQALINRLSMYVDGVFSFLNKPTNINFTNNFVCFDIGNIPKPVKPTLMFLVLDYLYMKMKKDKERKILLIDEAWSLLSRTEDASYIFEIVKTCRKFNMGLILINQEVEGLLSSNAGKSVLANSAYTFLMKQKPAVMEQITKTFNLSQVEREYLMSSQVGEGVLIIDDEHLELKVIASNEEHKVITTNADEILEYNNSGEEEDINISIDEFKGFFRYKKVKKDDREYLLSKGYEVVEKKTLLTGKVEKFLIKPRLKESINHIFVMNDIADYLESKGIEVQKYATKKPDLVFKVNGKKIAIEVETGTVSRNVKSQLTEKVNMLNKNYDSWFFVMTNRNFTKKYRKYGKAIEMRYLENHLKKVLKTDTKKSSK
jgi:conjugal transfer ATP-binding protein TraC